MDCSNPTYGCEVWNNQSNMYSYYAETFDHGQRKSLYWGNLMQVLDVNATSKCTLNKALLPNVNFASDLYKYSPNYLPLIRRMIT